MTTRHDSLVRALTQRAVLVCTLLVTVGSLASSVAAQAKGPTFLFIRHGESEVNVLQEPGRSLDQISHYPLTQAGVEQAADLGWSLKYENITALYSSNFLRCVQTADAIGFVKKLTLKISPEMREWDAGALPDPVATGPIVTDIISRWAAGETSAKNEKGLDTAESLDDLTARVAPWVKALIERHKNDQGIIVVVAHGGSIGWTLPSIASNVSLAFALKNGLHNTGIVRAELRDGKLFVVDWDGKKPE